MSPQRYFSFASTAVLPNALPPSVHTQFQGTNILPPCWGCPPACRGPFTVLDAVLNGTCAGAVMADADANHVLGQGDTQALFCKLVVVPPDLNTGFIGFAFNTNLSSCAPPRIATPLCPRRPQPQSAARHLTVSPVSDLKLISIG